MQFWAGVSEEKDGVIINNGGPGLNDLTIWVNDRSFEVHNLADRQTVTVDISLALQAGNNNTITVGAVGGSIGDAQVVLGRKSERPKGKSRIGVLAR